MAMSDPMKARLKNRGVIDSPATRSDRVAEHDPALDYEHDYDRRSPRLRAQSTGGCHVNSRLDRTFIDRTVLPNKTEPRCIRTRYEIAAFQHGRALRSLSLSQVRHSGFLFVN